MIECRECKQKVSEQAFACPHCGAPYPTRPQWDGWGFEYKSGATIGNWPLLHISFKYRPNRMPVPARGIIAIGQFGMGVVTVAQFGVGIFTLGQFALGAYVLAQFAAAYRCIAQVAFYVDKAAGQILFKLADLF